MSSDLVTLGSVVPLLLRRVSGTAAPADNHARTLPRLPVVGDAGKAPAQLDRGRNSPRCSKTARIAAASASVTTNIAGAWAFAPWPATAPSVVQQERPNPRQPRSQPFRDRLRCQDVVGHSLQPHDCRVVGVLRCRQERNNVAHRFDWRFYPGGRCTRDDTGKTCTVIIVGRRSTTSAVRADIIAGIRGRASISAIRRGTAANARCAVRRRTLCLPPPNQEARWLRAGEGGRLRHGD